MYQPWLPPPDWHGDDGCSGVSDHHYKAACRIHDWQNRHATRPPMMYWWMAKILSDIEFLFRMIYLNRQTEWGEWLIRWWWRPYVRFLGVSIFGWRYFHRVPVPVDS